MSIPEVIEKLIGAGWSEVALAREAGISQASINRIRRGKQRPSYEAGAKLIALAPKLPADDASQRTQEAA